MAPADSAADNPDRIAEAAAAYNEPAAHYDPVVAGVRARRHLESAEFKREQADAVVLAMRELAGDLASKTDLTIAVDRLEVALDAKSTKESVAELRVALDTKASAESVTELRTVLDTKASAESVTELRTVLDTKASAESVTELRAVLETKSTKSDIARLEGEIATLRDGEIATIQNTMATKEDIARLEGEIAAIKNTMASKADIADMATKSDVSSAEKRIVLWLFGAILAAAGLLATVSGLF